MRKGRNDQPPVIPTPNGSRAHCCNTTGLLCALFQCEKGVCTESGAKYSKETGPGALKLEDLEPGQKVSVNQ
eukprot:5578953-Ditylum_brightwellii.AAC.2